MVTCWTDDIHQRATRLPTPATTGMNVCLLAARPWNGQTYRAA